MGQETTFKQLFILTVSLLITGAGAYGQVTPENSILQRVKQDYVTPHWQKNLPEKYHVFMKTLPSDILMKKQNDYNRRELKPTATQSRLKSVLEMVYDEGEWELLDSFDFVWSDAGFNNSDEVINSMIQSNEYLFYVDNTMLPRGLMEMIICN